MNILFIGPYRQNDGWGLAARDYLSCLKNTESNSSLKTTVSSVPIYMSNNINNDISDTILEAEITYCDKFDVIIQNVLPNYFVKTNPYTIGIYYSETKDLNYSLFIEKINLLDELWVSSESEKKTLRDSGVHRNTKISVIPIPLNTNEIDEYKELSSLSIPSTDKKFNFYILAEYNERKNIEAAIIAFNREFSNDGVANLIIKTTINGMPVADGQKYIMDDILRVKKNLRLYNKPGLYANEILVNPNLTFEQILSLHKTGDCLLVPSRGEAYCRPAMEALYFNNQVICTEGIHTCSILENHHTKVQSMKVPININNPPAPHIYTGWETWNEISIIDLQKKMREAITNKTKESKNWVKNNFSYEAISKKMEKRLCQL